MIVVDTTTLALIELRTSIQRNRIQMGNRLNADERGADQLSKKGRELYEKYSERFEENEKEIEKDIKKLIKGIQIIEDMQQVKGIGPMFAASLAAMIDIERSPNFSNLLRYSGYGIKDGKIDKPTKGQKLPYNKHLKTLLYNIATSFMKVKGSPYRVVYDTAKAYYEQSRPEWTDMHRHRAATRKMIKVFVSHLYEHWKSLDGVKIRHPYVYEYLGHTQKWERLDFGWPDTVVVRYYTQIPQVDISGDSPEPLLYDEDLE